MGAEYRLFYVTTMFSHIPVIVFCLSTVHVSLNTFLLTFNLQWNTQNYYRSYAKSARETENNETFYRMAINVDIFIKKIPILCISLRHTNTIQGSNGLHNYRTMRYTYKCITCTSIRSFHHNCHLCANSKTPSPTIVLNVLIYFKNT